MLLLDPLDKKILSAISHKAGHSSHLSTLLCEPRTSLSYRLHRLEQFGKVEKFTVGRKIMWRRSLSRAHNKSLFQVYKGDDFVECYKLLGTLKKNSMIYVVQGKMAAKGELRNVPEDLMVHIHALMKRRKIIMKAIANEEILQEFVSLSKRLKKSHTGRPQSIKLIDNKFLSSGELFVSYAYIAIINPDKKIGIVIKDKDIVSMFYDFMILFFSISERMETFNLNAFISKTL